MSTVQQLLDKKLIQPPKFLPGSIHLAQMKMVVQHEACVGAVLCSDGHLGHSARSAAATILWT